MHALQLDHPVPSKIAVRGLNFYYGKFHALKGINLDIPRKGHGLHRPLGLRQIDAAAPSTACSSCTPSSVPKGQILLDGENLLQSKRDVALIRAKVGMVFQKPTPFPMSIYDNIAFGVKLFESLNATDMDERVGGR